MNVRWQLYWRHTPWLRMLRISQQLLRCCISHPQQISIGHTDICTFLILAYYSSLSLLYYISASCERLGPVRLWWSWLLPQSLNVCVTVSILVYDLCNRQMKLLNKIKIPRFVSSKALDINIEDLPLFQYCESRNTMGTEERFWQHFIHEIRRWKGVAG